MPIPLNPAMFGLPGPHMAPSLGQAASQALPSAVQQAAPQAMQLPVGGAPAGAGLGQAATKGFGAVIGAAAQIMENRKKAKQAEQQAQALIQSQKLQSATNVANTAQNVKQAADTQNIRIQGQTAEQQAQALRDIIGGFRSAILGR